MNGREPTDQTALTPLFAIKKTNKRRAKNLIDVFWTKSMDIPINSYDRWNQILQNLYLGIIPDKKEAEEIIRKIPNLGLVVSAVESFEFVDKQTAADWHKAGIAHHEIPIRDYTIDVDPENVFHAVQLMHSYLLQGKAVYVHCKAGKSRSATIVAAYIAIHACGDDKPFHANATIEDIHGYMLSKRRQLLIKDTHFIVVGETKEFHEQNQFQPTTYLKDNELSVAHNLDMFFESAKTKREITNLLSFKNLKHYAQVKNSDERNKYISSFLSAIEKAVDASWYIDFITGRSQLHELKDLPAHGKFFESLGLGKPAQRIQLIDSFMTEMQELVRVRLDYSHKDIIGLINSMNTRPYI